VKYFKSPLWVLARRDLSVMFSSPGTYIISVVFLMTVGWLFISPFFLVNQSSLETFLAPVPILFTFLIPALTMKLFAEEFKTGTMECLATLPVKDYEIVLGKYLAALGLVATLLVFTLFYPLVLFCVGRPDLGEILGGYGAVVGLAVFFAAIGLWASSLTRNQVIAFILAFFVCFAFFLLNHVADFLPGVLADWVRWCGVDGHFQSLSRGVFDSRDLIYWLSGAVLFLSSCLITVHSRRWL